MDKLDHNVLVIAFTLILALVFAGPLALLLNESGDADDRTRTRSWPGTPR